MDGEIIYSWCFNDVECFDSTPSAAIIILNKDLESFSSLRSQHAPLKLSMTELLYVLVKVRHSISSMILLYIPFFDNDGTIAYLSFSLGPFLHCQCWKQVGCSY